MRNFSGEIYLPLSVVVFYCLLGVVCGQQGSPDPLVLKTLNLHGDDIADIKNTMKQLIADNQALKTSVDQLKLENAALKASVTSLGNNLTQCCSHQQLHTTPIMITTAPTRKTTTSQPIRTTTGHTLDPLGRCQSLLNITEGPIKTDGKYCYQLFTLQLTTSTPTDLCGQMKRLCASRGGYLSTAESDVLNSALVPDNSYVLADEPHRSRRFMYYTGCVMWKKNHRFNVELVSHTSCRVIRIIMQLDL